MDSDGEYEVIPCRMNSCTLPFDRVSLENFILTISDQFNFRVVLSDERTTGALLLTAGLTIAGGFVGRHYGGKVGAIFGSAVGGACGVGLVAVSMRDVWEDIKEKLWGLLEVVYDYLAGMGLQDYKNVARFVASRSGCESQIAMLILETASSTLGKKIISNLTTSL
ncbi:hypothetical protein K1T71_012004 [Dendrolimus kikuchii]|uniref:Uncharacterized protein n=1 Tax=Dendrolimus kikuchii TaxID=765133 RepID=A0ACC1CKF7_9NEOP|nr:hypothetical protein K1T71_012004 [Dendrolimus kikuchii]